MLASRRLTKNISDNYNAPSSDRFSSKTKICKTHCMLGNSLLCKLFLTSPTKDLLSSLKNQNDFSSTSGSSKYMKSHLKENARTFSSNFTTQETIRTSRLKTRLRNLHNKKYFKPEIKPMTENLPDKLYQLVNMQKV